MNKIYNHEAPDELKDSKIPENNDEQNKYDFVAKILESHEGNYELKKMDYGNDFSYLKIKENPWQWHLIKFFDSKYGMLLSSDYLINYSSTKHNSEVEGMLSFQKEKEYLLEYRRESLEDFERQMLELKEVTKEFGNKKAVNEISFTVKNGNIYGIVGRNGAGKSTTMKMLLGLVKPTSGTIEIMGKLFNEKNRKGILQSVGSLIEAPSYYGHLTGHENMELIRRLLDLPQKNIDEAIHIVRLENQMNKKVKNYSLGMKQRLGIAMALARKPKLLILDEPANGLDPAGIEEIRELIKTLPSKYGMTVMISSHILSEIDQMATVIGIINQGSLIFQERMSVLDEQRKPQIILKTSDDDTAYRFLAKLNPQRTLNGLQLGSLTDEQTGAVVRELCSNNLSVYRVEEHRESLEDIFLTLTGKELTL